MIDLGILRIFDYQPSLTHDKLYVFRCGCQMVTLFHPELPRMPHRLNLIPQCGLRHDYDDELRKLDPCVPDHWPFQMEHTP